MNNYTYDDLPESAQKIFRTTNKIRKAVLFLCIFCTVALFIITFICSEEKNIIMSLVCSLLVGPGILAWVHLEFAFKKIMKSLSIFGIIPVLVVAGITSYAGWVYMIIDIVLLIKKKPLMFKSDINEIVKFYCKPEDMATSVMMSINKNQESQSAMETLEKLKSLQENGVITDEEFELKKAELLKSIK